MIEEQALESAVQLSERYITDRNLPDKAIDVLDEACSKVSLKGYEVPENLKQLEQAVKEPVSYTHLDVYKRQVLDLEQQDGSPFIMC